MSKVGNTANSGTETVGLPESAAVPIQDTAMPSTIYGQEVIHVLAKKQTAKRLGVIASAALGAPL